MIKSYQWINPHFRRYFLRFFFQTIFIVVFMLFVMVALIYGRTKPMDVLSAIGASSVAASAFIVFALPASQVSMPHRIFGSYVIAIICGISWHFLIPYINDIFPIGAMPARCVASAFSTGCTMLLMAMLDFEHPPAMGLALGLVMDVWDDWTLFIVIIAVLMLCVLKVMLRRWFINLL